MKKVTPKTARFLAITILTKLKQTRMPVTALFDEQMQKHAISSSERRLAFNLIYGVLRHYQYLDHILASFCRKPLKKLHPTVHQALRVGLFQILFLDRIPSPAAVNETVDALKTCKGGYQLTGLVNGILRAIIRQQDLLSPHTELRSQKPPILNHPEWLTNRWQQHFGSKKMLQICRSNNNQAPLTLRVNPLVTSKKRLFDKLISLGIDVADGVYAPDALILPQYLGSITDLPGFFEGAFQIQDEGAQLIPYLLIPFSKNGHYLDGCAGLGGKTSHLVQLGQESHIHVTAVEPQSARFKLLQENLKRLQMESLATTHFQSLQDFCTHDAKAFDGVLLDVPCSGTGVIGRHPDIRWNRKKEDLLTYQRTQMQLLDCGSKVVRKNGVLIYSTCSLEPEENSAVITSFLKNNDHFHLEDPSVCLPESSHHFVKDNCLQVLPDQRIDGFFAARMVRKQ